MKGKKMIKLVIFDYDGVMVDSTKHNQQAFIKSFKHFGYDVNGEDFDIGEKLVNQFAHVTQKYSLNLGYKEFEDVFGEEKKKDKTSDEFNKDLIPLFQKIRETLPLAIVSNRPEEIIYQKLESQGADRLFNVIIGGKEGVFGKGKEDRLEAVLKQFGIDGNQAVLIDDVPKHIEAAHKLGIRTIGYVHNENQHMEFPSYCPKPNTAKELEECLDNYIEEGKA